MSTATFVGTDTTTQGTWVGVYGANGRYKFENGASLLDGSTLPSGVTVTELNSPGTFGYASGTSDVRDLQRAASPTLRDAGIWYSSGNFSFRVTPSDATVRRVRMYCCDRDAAGRVQIVSVKDHGGSTLDSRNLSSFATGTWLSWDVSGDVDFVVTNNGGPNAISNGIFFDDAAGGGGGVTVGADALHYYREHLMRGAV